MLVKASESPYKTDGDYSCTVTIGAKNSFETLFFCPASILKQFIGILYILGNSLMLSVSSLKLLVHIGKIAKDSSAIKSIVGF